MDTYSTKPKTPGLVIFVSILLLLSGVGSAFSSLLFFLFNLSFALFSLVIGVGQICVAVGLLLMRKWALYMFTSLTILAVGYSAYLFVSSQSQSFITYGSVLIQVLILVYLFSISDKFFPHSQENKSTTKKGIVIATIFGLVLLGLIVFVTMQVNQLKSTLSDVSTNVTTAPVQNSTQTSPTTDDKVSGTPLPPMTSLSYQQISALPSIAKNNLQISTVLAVTSILKNYYDNNGDVNVITGADTSNSVYPTNLSSSFGGVAPVDPVTRESYQYSVINNGKNYTLCFDLGGKQVCGDKDTDWRQYLIR